MLWLKWWLRPPPLKCSSSRSDITIYILRSISKNWAVVVAEKRGEEDANPWLNLPEAAAFTKGFSSAVRMVDSGWFDMNCEESKLGLPAFRQNGVGDVVSVRRIYSGGKNPDKLSYCCLALLKAYFTKTPRVCIPIHSMIPWTVSV